MTLRSPFTLLLVEDDEVDTEAVRRALKRGGLQTVLHVVTDGVDALDALRDAIGGECVAVVDLNMPRMNGIEFLDVLRKDPDLRDLPVFVLTTSNDLHDREAARARGVEGYFVKTRSRRGFDDLVEALRPYLDASHRATQES